MRRVGNVRLFERNSDHVHAVLEEAPARLSRDSKVPFSRQAEGPVLEGPAGSGLTIWRKPQPLALRCARGSHGHSPRGAGDPTGPSLSGSMQLRSLVTTSLLLDHGLAVQGRSCPDRTEAAANAVFVLSLDAFLAAPSARCGPSRPGAGGARWQRGGCPRETSGPGACRARVAPGRLRAGGSR